jgi:hypothetical protein
MHTRRQGPSTPRSALVLVPAKLNYFYDLHGRRLAEALHALGFDVEVSTLARRPEKNYDWCVLTNISEIVLSHDKEDAEDVTGDITWEEELAAIDAIRRLHKHCRVVTACSLDCVGTAWYSAIEQRCAASAIATILDFGLHDQSRFLGPDGPERRPAYWFVPNGLTPSERRALDSATDDHRPLPWAFVGHTTANRAALVDRLMQQVDPRGFVYMPGIGKITEKGSPHLNQKQYDTVLRRTRYQVWCSHHTHFYMESERFRMSLLAGSVPVKVVPDRKAVPPRLLFDYLVLDEEEVAGRLREMDFAAVRRRFRDDFRAVPGVAAGLAGYLVAAGVLRPGEAEEAAEPEESPGMRKAG